MLISPSPRFRNVCCFRRGESQWHSATEGPPPRRGPTPLMRSRLGAPRLLLLE